jgi:hypothetical protein
MSHQTPKVMSFLPRSASSTRASVAPVRVPGSDNAARHGSYDAQNGLADGDLCPPQPCSAHTSAPVIVMVMRNRRGSGAVPLSGPGMIRPGISRPSYILVPAEAPGSGVSWTTLACAGAVSRTADDTLRLPAGIGAFAIESGGAVSSQCEPAPQGGRRP